MASPAQRSPSTEASAPASRADPRGRDAATPPVLGPVEEERDGVRVEALDISQFHIVEVDFDEDLTRANEFVES